MSTTQRFPFAHTFSIVARDLQSGEMGVAVQSHWFSVGALVPWGEAGVGVVATQSMVDPSYGPLGLEMMRAGRSAPDALRGLLAADEGRDLRQVAMVDAQGMAAVHTGARCIADAGHELGEGFSVQANMMANPSIWPAMAQAYRQSSGHLADRLIAALKAAQAAGGDVRGQQSAALLVVKAESTGRSWNDRLVELRVEDHSDPIGELARLLEVHTAYDWMNLGDERLSQGKFEEALEAYRQAAGLAPEMAELPFWHAVTLTDLDRVEEALPIFRSIFKKEPHWANLLQRLPAAGLLKADDATLARISAERGA